MKGSYLHIYNFFTDIIYSLIIVWFEEKKISNFNCFFCYDFTVHKVNSNSLKKKTADQNFKKKRILDNRQNMWMVAPRPGKLGGRSGCKKRVNHCQRVKYGGAIEVRSEEGNGYPENS